MGDLSRRVFIRHGMMGAAAVSVAAPMLPAIVGTAAEEAPEADGVAADIPAVASNAEPLVARIKDAASGEIELFLGERQLIYHDPAIAARLLRAAR